jgi:protein phosphatase
MKNVILRALGLEDHVPIDLSRKSLAAGDVFLLATDGLTDQTPDPAIAACLRQHAAPEQQVAALISRALAAGGPDNVTALSIVVEDPA